MNPSKNPESPPLFKNWRSWYLLVLLELAGIVAVFSLIPKIFG